jgi:hypothetical protein
MSYNCEAIVDSEEDFELNSSRLVRPSVKIKDSGRGDLMKATSLIFLCCAPRASARGQRRSILSLKDIVSEEILVCQLS